MNGYGQSKFGYFKQKVKSFFFKLLLLIVVTSCFIGYFLYTDFGNKNGVVYDLKNKANLSLKDVYNKQADSFEVTIRDMLGIPKEKKVVKPKSNEKVLEIDTTVPPAKSD